MLPYKSIYKAIVLASIGLASLNALADDFQLAKSNNCLACHSVDKKVVGPAFKDVASKYKGDPAAAKKLVAKVRNGGSGSWGQIPMPANTQVSEEDAKKLVAWILTQ